MTTEALQQREDLLQSATETARQRLLSRIHRLTPESIPEEVAGALVAVDFLKRITDEVKKAFNAAFIKWLEERGELQIGDDRYYVGTRKKTVCRDVTQTLDVLLELCAGDLGQLADALRSDPVKHGAFRSLLREAAALGGAPDDEATDASIDEIFDDHFRVEELKEAKTGKPRRGVVKVNTHFLPPRGR